MSKVIIDWDSKYKKAQIISDSLDIIRHHFSVPNSAASILRRRHGQGARIAQRFYAITEGGRFEIGLLVEVLQYLRSAAYDFDIILTPLLEDQISVVDSESFKLPTLSMAPRDFQVTGVEKGLKVGRGVFIVGTGGGKTYLMALIDRAFKQRSDHTTTLIALPAQLVRQTSNDLIEYGISADEISIWSEGSSLELKPIIIASYTTIQSQTTSFKRLKKRNAKKNESQDEYTVYTDNFEKTEKERLKDWKRRKKRIVELLQQIDLVIFDEVHSIRQNNKINKLFDMLHTRHLFGLTGTMPDNKVDCWNIIGKIGPVLDEVTAFDLETRGYVAKAVARIIQINHTYPIEVVADFNNPTKAYMEECEWLFTNTFRNSVISKLCGKLPNNTLIVVDKLLHGDTLYDTLSKELTNKQVYWIRGETASDEREFVRAEMETNSNIVCIAMSKIFSTGTNIKNIHYVMFAQGGKAKIRVIQSIGRGRRLHSDKNELVILDITDNTKYSLDALAERLLRYQEEQISYEIKQIYEETFNKG